MFLQWLNDLVYHSTAKHAKTENPFKCGKYEAKLLVIFVILLTLKVNSNDLNGKGNILKYLSTGYSERMHM